MRRIRWRCAGKWMCAGGAVVLAAISVASGWRFAACTWSRQRWACYANCTEGRVQFGGVSRPKAQQQLGLAVINVSRSELRMPSPLWSWGFKRYSPSGGYWGGIDVPLWAPVAVLGVTALWLWYLDRPRPPGACPKCGYDLTGNTTGICPECGKAGPAASGA